MKECSKMKKVLAAMDDVVEVERTVAETISDDGMISAAQCKDSDCVVESESAKVVTDLGAKAETPDSDVDTAAGDYKAEDGTAELKEGLSEAGCGCLDNDYIDLRQYIEREVLPVMFGRNPEMFREGMISDGGVFLASMYRTIGMLFGNPEQKMYWKTAFKIKEQKFEDAHGVVKIMRVTMPSVEKIGDCRAIYFCEDRNGMYVILSTAAAGKGNYDLSWLNNWGEINKLASNINFVQEAGLIARMLQLHLIDMDNDSRPRVTATSIEWPLSIEPMER